MHFVISENPSQSTFVEEWLSPPLVVPGTAANEVWPAVQAGLPEELRLKDGDTNLNTADLQETLGGVDFLVFAPIGDRASSNVSMMRRWAHLFSTLPRSVYCPMFLYIPDTCQIHSHHRGKLSLKDLRPHTTVMYSMANLFKLRSVQSQVVATMEVAIQQGFRRHLRPPPPASERWRTFMEVPPPPPRRWTRARVREKRPPRRLGGVVGRFEQ